METHLHTGASAPIHGNLPLSPERGLRSALGVPIPGSGPAGAATGHLPASRGTHDEARRPHAKSPIDRAIFMGQRVVPRDGAIACRRSRAKPLDATAPAFVIAIRPA
ncbi:hypothetical protein [Burkholderia sp. BCC0322]|uniref:hypothetical protein n=1 Tax=unclassified Burkholderia TaxID=2613784 RepID=UPI001FC8E68E|nr:hypothetical protein [Burkholderia sp. BCC0322]